MSCCEGVWDLYSEEVNRIKGNNFDIVMYHNRKICNNCRAVLSEWFKSEREGDADLLEFHSNPSD